MKKQELSDLFDEDMLENLKHFCNCGGAGYMDSVILKRGEEEIRITKEEMLISSKKIIEAFDAEKRGDMDAFNRLSKELML